MKSSQLQAIYCNLSNKLFKKISIMRKCNIASHATTQINQHFPTVYLRNRSAIAVICCVIK